MFHAHRLVTARRIAVARVAATPLAPPQHRSYGARLHRLHSLRTAIRTPTLAGSLGKEPPTSRLSDLRLAHVFADSRHGRCDDARKHGARDAARQPFRCAGFDSADVLAWPAILPSQCHLRRRLALSCLSG